MSIKVSIIIVIDSVDGYRIERSHCNTYISASETIKNFPIRCRTIKWHKLLSMLLIAQSQLKNWVCLYVIHSMDQWIWLFGLHRSSWCTSYREEVNYWRCVLRLQVCDYKFVSLIETQNQLNFLARNSCNYCISFMHRLFNLTEIKMGHFKVRISCPFSH